MLSQKAAQGIRVNYAMHCTKQGIHINLLCQITD